MSPIDLLIILFVLVSTVGGAIVGRKVKPTIKGSTVILSHAFQGGVDAMASKAGNTPGGLYFQYLVGMSFKNNGVSGVYSVELPFASGVHLLGIPKEGSDVGIDLSGSVMELVELEGDYPNYFSLYADKDQQAKTHYVLDPKAMVFTIDFCSKFAWEIVDDSLYFSSESDTVTLEMIDQFVKEIRPSIEVESDRKSNPQLKMPYGQIHGRSLGCPICSEKLIAKKHWVACPQGHGILITGSELGKLRSAEDSDADNKMILDEIGGSGDNPVEHGDLVCPYCSAPMESNEFGTTKVHIERCTKCMFRWLDAGEARHLFVE